MPQVSYNEIMLHIGCCGFAKARQKYYQHLALVEVQQTFYKLPRLTTAQRWRTDAPLGFEFALKATQLITHPASSPTYRKVGVRIDHPGRYGFFRPTDEVFGAWARTREIAEALRARWIIFQCPPSFAPSEEHSANLRAFFGSIERGGLRFAWEPRGEWPDETIAALCRDLDLIHVVDPFHRVSVTRGLAYLRLHGIAGYRYRYTEADLDQLLAGCRGYTEAYCLFNNISMWDDALRLAQKLGTAMF
jgi:uncharacterized protein YecE (DUF72 family)